MTATERIPLRDREGNVRAWAIVDPEMHPIISSKRWCLASNGSAMRTEGRRTVAMHRAILGLPRSGPPAVRHANGNPLDNRRSNLVVSRRWLARTVADNDFLAQLVTRLGTSSTSEAPKAFSPEPPKG